MGFLFFWKILIALGTISFSVSIVGFSFCSYLGGRICSYSRVNSFRMFRILNFMWVSEKFGLIIESSVLSCKELSQRCFDVEVHSSCLLLCASIWQNDFFFFFVKNRFLIHNFVFSNTVGSFILPVNQVPLMEYIP